ncbi:bifunctional indole-3-glycerol-phosphate synthase TrpC/phosphoribosylanthranilate isomerase TrpF [Helicobacter bizzozeronii]|uniref:bifunctional indole-3-glycerol-phosphate synthase TrpC/phosphoribosylanthranilate isomerase TrpF n=1 Tax=Helicobacter bizzozeronii TaxID=56877 RepID=UPI000CF091C8|nr:bifunctional indole-3-glycerol-phosphate synthase TrpC/phosphoribosylanthranilate isomerase TrpF [Helicobacter bizzozeronii]
MPNHLQQILERKKEEIQALKMRFSIPKTLKPSTRDFHKALQERRTSFILECKKASPSKGLICPNFDLPQIVKIYDKYATCLSVLTDKAHFQGSYENLKLASTLTTKPLLCKDFILEPFQVLLARYMGANAILLMLSVLEDCTYTQLAKLAKSLGMAILTEVSDESQAKRALNLGASIIGINNRDLKTLQVDLNTTLRLQPLIPKGITIISESGINTHSDIKKLCPHVDGFLVGSSLMAQGNLKKACQKLILGENKICGLRRVKDAKRAHKNGFIYGGLIFDPNSPRYISPKKARKLVRKVPQLDFVGVFVHANIKTIIKRAYQLNLKAVQLHGDYSTEQIVFLKQALECPVWQVVRVSPKANTLKAPNLGADLILYDSQGVRAGGNGVAFNWEILAHAPSPFMLAGGLNPNNLKKALQVGAVGLDINSGAEIAPGKKSPSKIKQLAQILREY